MTWRRAGVYWAIFVGLTAYYVAVLYRPAGHAAAHLTRAPFINMPDSQIQALELRRGSVVVRCRRVGGRWQVVEPPDSKVPPDLVAALAVNLTSLPDVEVIADHSKDLAQYGLDTPMSQITLTPAAGEPITVRLGSRNPSGTAVYAQRNDGDRVYLIGLNVRYYEDLLFGALGVSTRSAQG